MALSWAFVTRRDGAFPSPPTLERPWRWWRHKGAPRLGAPQSCTWHLVGGTWHSDPSPRSALWRKHEIIMILGVLWKEGRWRHEGPEHLRARPLSYLLRKRFSSLEAAVPRSWRALGSLSPTSDNDVTNWLSPLLECVWCERTCQNLSSKTRVFQKSTRFSSFFQCGINNFDIDFQNCD